MRANMPYLYTYLAAHDPAVVQGGLTTCLELITLRRLLLAAMLAVLISGCSSPAAWKPPASPPVRSPSVQSPSAQSPLPAPSVAIAQAAPLLVGAYEKGVPQSWSPMATFASAARVTPTITGYYSSWGEQFQAGFARTAWSHGAYVFGQLEPWTVSCASIAAGKSDAFLRSYADAVRAFRHPVILSFGHEANGTWYPWGEGTPPKDYVAAWRHIVTVFRQQGADNVTWLWVMNIGRFRMLPGLYPGASYVTWIGVTGYLSRPGDTFSSVLEPTISYVRQLAPGKPVILDETGVAPGSDRPAQISDLFAGVRAMHLLGLLYFDIDQTGGQYKQDWRLEGNPAALAAFRRAARGV